MDNTYVGNSKEKETGVQSLYFGAQPDNIDEYTWPGFERTNIYSIFPENKITLPKADKT